MNKVEKIYKEIEKLQEEIQEIQHNCKHTHYRIGLYELRTASYIETRICSVCYKNLGMPSHEELKEFKDENNTGQGIKIYKNSKDYSKMTPKEVEDDISKTYYNDIATIFYSDNNDDIKYCQCVGDPGVDCFSGLCKNCGKPKKFIV